MGEGRDKVGDSPVETASLERVEALLEAARYDDMDDLKSLESAGLSLDSKDLHGRTALHMTSANGHLQIVEYLISRGVVVKKLILAGANLSVLNSYERTPVDEAVSRGKMDVLDAVNAAAAQVELRDVSVS